MTLFEEKTNLNSSSDLIALRRTSENHMTILLPDIKKKRRKTERIFKNG